MMSVEPGILDANILVYAVDADAPQHAACRALIDAARDPAARLYLTSQILCEFYSVITNPRRVAAARSSAEALDALAALLGLPGIHILPTPPRAVTGGDVFDPQLIATMQANNILRIYTFNTEDFEAFPELSVRAPSAT